MSIRKERYWLQNRELVHGAKMYVMPQLGVRISWRERCKSGPRHQNSLFIRSARCVTQKIIGDRLHLTARRRRIFLIRLTELLRTHRSQHALRTLAVHKSAHRNGLGYSQRLSHIKANRIIETLP